MNEPKKRGRRAVGASLNRERIELAALEMIEEGGLEAFSIRKLGARMQCEPMSLYHYFASKAALFDALVERLLGTFELPADDLPPREALRFMAHQWRKIALTYPHFFPFFSMHRLNSDVGAAFLDRVLSRLQKMGLSHEVAARFFRVINYYLIGAALDEAAGYAKGASSLTPISDEEVAARYPALSSASPYFHVGEFESNFEFGLSLLLGEARVRLGGDG